MSKENHFEVPVLIVGGAGAGLASSIFLSEAGVESWLVERHPATSPAPKAHYINTRAMEIFREVGVSEKIYELGAPSKNMDRVGWYTSLGGDGPLARKTIGVVDAFGGGALREAYRAASPCLPSNYPQLRLEPLMLEKAKESSLASINFYHEMTSFEQDAKGVTATIQRREDGSSYTVRAQYMIAADGGKSIGADLGIQMDGQERLFDMMSAHFEADLSDYIEDDGVMIRWFNNPDSTGGTWGSGVIVAMGPEHYDQNSKEWLIHFSFQPDDPEQFDADSMGNRIRALFGLPDLELNIIKMNNWNVQGVLAREFRAGRVFLVGDAAHRHPPTTGLGLNSAIQDAHNLAWKIGAVLNGSASDKLLDSYHDERHAVTGDNVNWALFAFQNHLCVDAAIGLIPGAPVEVNRAAFELLFSDSKIGRSRRARLDEVLQTMRIEFQALDVELGYSYESNAVVPDGTVKPLTDPFGTEYIADARPGHRFPHFWVTRDGAEISILDVFGRGQFVLLTDGDGEAWTKACGIISKNRKVELASYEIGRDIVDMGDRWRSLTGVEGGAVLVRPDGHVAWRSKGAPSDPESALEQTLGTILGS